MKYFLIAGEASGDLHASNLMRALKAQDHEAEFRFFGGDKMQAVGGTLLNHYRDIAYMGFIAVALHARTILRAMRYCKQAIVDWQPDVVILVDYPGFNLKIAAYVRKHMRIPVYYYISPKIWAWKERRIHAIKRDVDEMFSILPFEVDFYRKHSYPIHYVGNPSVDEIAEWKACRNGSIESPHSRIIALLPGSRISEIRANLPLMLRAAAPYAGKGYEIVVAGAPDMDDSLYRHIEDSVNLNGLKTTIMRNSTFALLDKSEAALVTSGTATLETALLNVPQVVCYYMKAGKFVSLLRRLFLKVKYISLVNLIVDRELVPELVADRMTESNLAAHLASIVEGGAAREALLSGYREMTQRLGEAGAPRRAAKIMIATLAKASR